MAAIKKKLGELLQEAGLIDDLQLQAALAHQKEWGGRLGSIFIRKGFVKESAMIAVIEKQMGMSCLPLEKFERPSEEILRLVKEDIARRFCILPQRLEGKTLLVATSDPTDLKLLDDLGFLLGNRIKPVLALEADILAALDHYYNPSLLLTELKRKSYSTFITSSSGNKDSELLQDNSTPSAGEYPPKKPGVGNTVAPPAREHPPIELSSGNSVAPPAREHPPIKLSTGNSEQDVLAGIVDLLVEKGIFTRDELAERIKFRKG